MKIITILLTLLITFLSAYANEKENIIKGVVLERIAQFITYHNNEKKLIICVYKDKGLARTFKKVYEGRKYKGKPVVVILAESLEDIPKCSIVYVHDLDKATVKKIVAKSQTQTLLVTQNIEDIDYGFMIAMFFEDKKIKFAVNHGAINGADLKVNYRLLKVAKKIINPVKDSSK